jgi:DNA polymerase III subunit epsilon
VGLFDKLTSMFRGGTPAATPATASEPRERPAEGLTLTVTIIGQSGPAVPVSDAEVADAMARCKFVLGNQLPPLKTADQWWEEAAHKRRLREGSEKAFSWLSPFIQGELAKCLAPETIKGAFGPLQAKALAKEFRAVVRERRRLKQPHEDVLRALYGACVMADFVDSLLFEGYQPHHMAQFVSAAEFQSVQVDYASMGYQCVEALGKTDIKWLVEAFGEPAEHLSFNAAWPAVWQNAISRKCWAELTQQNESAKALGLPEQSMQDWLSAQVRRNIGYHKEWQQRVKARLAHDAEAVAGIDAALAATAQPFVVADLETTGLRAEESDILEFAAVQVGADGAIQAVFSMLVNVGRPLPPEIVRLTGITDEDVAREGRPIVEALGAFLAFVGTQPVFFHNAPFDQGFLKRAAAASKKKFPNPVHDTLPLARRAWPELCGYKLGGLAAHVGVPAPTHRALSDSRATLAVLLAARAKLIK